MLRLLVADDDPVVRRGLRMRLALEADFDVIGEAGDGATAIELAASLAPDVVILDADLPVLNGVSAVARLRRAGCHARIIILTFHDDAATRARARAAGADAFVAKGSTDASLDDAIRQLACD